MYLKNICKQDTNEELAWGLGGVEAWRHGGLEFGIF